MVTLQTGVLGDLAVLLVEVVFKFECVIALIHHRSTMAQTAKDLVLKHSHATYYFARVKDLCVVVLKYRKEKSMQI